METSPGRARRLIVCGLIVGLTLVCGLVLNITKPVWLVPPLYRTLVLYLALGVAWLPVAAVCAWLVRRDMRPVTLMLAILAVFLVGGMMTCIAAPSQINGNVLVDDFVTCVQESLPEDRVRYTCTLTLIFYYEVYTLEGLQGSPFLRLVDHQTGGS